MVQGRIELRGVAVNNLRHVDLDLPHRKLTRPCWHWCLSTGPPFDSRWGRSRCELTASPCSSGVESVFCSACSARYRRQFERSKCPSSTG